MTNFLEGPPWWEKSPGLWAQLVPGSERLKVGSPVSSVPPGKKALGPGFFSPEKGAQAQSAPVGRFLIPNPVLFRLPK